MDTTTITKEIKDLIFHLQNHFESISSNEQVDEEKLEVFLKNISSIQKKAIVWQYINTFEKQPFEINKTEEVPIVIKVEESQKAEKLIVKTPSKPIDDTPLNPETTPQENTPQPPPSERIIDIKSKIGIADKFEFINELFKGNFGEYDTAVAKLNTSTTLQNGLQTFEELKKQYEWNDDNESATKFLEIIKNCFL